MSQDQYDIFGLMAPEEAEEFKPKAKVIVGTTLTEIQHAKEKKGLAGEFKEGWEEATGSEKKSTPVATTSTIPNFSAKTKENVEKTAEYLSYKKTFCYAGHQILIEDPSEQMEQIRKRMSKMFPELSRERTDMTYTPPVIPKKKAKKVEESDDQSALGFETSEEVKSLEDLEKAASEDVATVVGLDFDEESENEDNEESVKAVDLTKKSEAKLVLLPSVVDGVERLGMIVPILKGARKGFFTKESDLERIFLKWNDLIDNPTVRNLMVGSDGLYEVRITPVGIFKVRISNEETIGADEVSEGVDLLLPYIPVDLFIVIRDFFVRLAMLDESLEALARIYHDGQKYFAHIPHQEVSHARVRALDYPEDLECAANNTLVMELHSHNVMAAGFSGIDDRDELATGLYFVWGDLDRLEEKKASVAFRFSCGGHYRELNIMDFVKGGLNVPRQLPDAREMDLWLSKVRLEGGESVG